MCDRLPGPSAGMLLGLLTILAMGCKKPVSPPAPPPPAVTVARPVQREVIEWDEYNGRIEAAETVEIRARVSGLIEKAEFEEGTLVTGWRS